eukprot:TRINITY_DN1020_c0_g2_i6.p3 TRINITY_DN1020_c0_g2~~TRINITY_DN1020_c0_g2_i6.p3  ORF type:complete len:187 (-),score=52.24 TRINITY_DN1020_c0_g2_i6:1235-1795(-)
MLVQPNPRIKTTMTLHVYNLHYNQSNPFSLCRDDVKVPAWKLVIQGKVKVLEDMEDKEQAIAVAPYLKMTRFVKKIDIEFNKEQADFPNLEWNRDTHSKELGEKDGIEILREGNKELNLTILIYINHSPKQYKVKPELSSIIGIKQCTRLQAISALWEYIKINRLQDQQDRQIVNCNKELQAVLLR